MNAVNRAAKKLSKKEKSGLTLHFRRAKIFLVTIEQAVVAELAGAHGSGPCGFIPWRFDSSQPHPIHYSS